MKTKILWLIGSIFFVQFSSAQKNSFAKDTTVILKVFGNCEMCKDRIEEASKGRGVRSAIWDVDSKMLTLTYDLSSTNSEKVQQRIADAGHDTELKKAKDYTYKQLPDCCLYRNGDHTHHDSDEEKNSVVLTGVVMEADDKGNFHALPNANVMWLGTNKGTMTDSNGVFKIFKDEGSERLIISYAGYKTDTMTVSDTRQVKLIMAAGKEMKEVKVTARQKSSYISSLNIFRTETMTDRELFKAACCNLSESFETNPSVDVSYNDAVTGSKQIQLLGLSGNYTQLTVENLPGPRGIATPLGLNSIAGPWVESIQLTKGIGSVANGYESIACQIHIEISKP